MFCFVLWNINLRAERRHFRRERTRVAGEEGKRSSVVDIDCRMRRRADLTTLVSLLAISVSYSYYRLSERSTANYQPILLYCAVPTQTKDFILFVLLATEGSVLCSILLCWYTYYSISCHVSSVADAAAARLVCFTIAIPKEINSSYSLTFRSVSAIQVGYHRCLSRHRYPSRTLRTFKSTTLRSSQQVY